MGLSRNQFKTALDLSVKNSFFMFQGNFYLQTDGLGMGLPLAPTLANLFLSHHEVNWLSDCPVEFRPHRYFRYVDDTFILFRKKSDCE